MSACRLACSEAKIRMLTRAFSQAPFLYEFRVHFFANSLNTVTGKYSANKFTERCISANASAWNLLRVTGTYQIHVRHARTPNAEISGAGRYC